MAVQITKVGSLPSEKSYSMWCVRCGTEFACLASDLRSSEDPRDQGQEAWISCPLVGCHKPVWTKR